MGRTGRFLACESLGVSPDYITLSKALGGGLAKISATLIRRERHIDKFDVLHTSTFAEDDYSSGIALKTLELLDETALAECRRKSGRLMRGLRQLMAAYPDIIVDVRGRGLMIGVEFRRMLDNPKFMLRLLTTQDDLVFVLVGYLFNEHRIRVAPTLSDPQTIRLEPSLMIDDSEIDRFIVALEDVCGKLRTQDVIGLTRYFIHGPDRQKVAAPVASEAKYVIYEEAPYWKRELDPPSIRVAWLFHLMNADDLITLEPGANSLTADERERYLRHFAPRSNPVVMSSVDVRSVTGATVRFYAILLPHTSRQMKQALEDHDFFRVRHSIDKAVTVARHIGCDVIALGQYNSIVTRNATTFALPDIGVTTGKQLYDRPGDRRHRPCAPGARDRRRGVNARGGGRVGQHRPDVCGDSGARSMAGPCWSAATRRAHGGGSVSSKRGCPAPRSRPTRWPSRRATSCSRRPTLPSRTCRPSILPRTRSSAICPYPAAVKRDVRSLRPDVLVLNGGIARLPFGENHGIIGFPLPAGQVYGCMGETMLLGLEGVRDATFTGTLPAENVVRLKAMADRHGFALADYKVAPTMGEVGARPDR